MTITPSKLHGSIDPPLTCAARELSSDLEARFTELVDLHHARALRLAWRLVNGDETAAEDIVQDALIRAYGALHRFRGESRLDTWFFRILVHQAHSYRRWRVVRERWSSQVPAESIPESVPISDPQLRQRIGHALSRLSRPQREAFLLIHMEGFSGTEAAEIMGRAPGTVKTHLKRALQSLRRELGDLLPEDRDR